MRGVYTTCTETSRSGVKTSTILNSTPDRRPTIRCALPGTESFELSEAGIFARAHRDRLTAATARLGPGTHGLDFASSCVWTEDVDRQYCPPTAFRWTD